MNKKYDFETPIDCSGLSRSKWEFEFERKGRDSLLAFGTADMDFSSPPEVVSALVETAQKGHFGYPYKKKSYHDAVRDYLKRQFDWDVKPEWIQFSTGVYASMQPVIEALSEPGDEIIFQPPVHHIFAELIQANKRVAVENPLLFDGVTYKFDFDHLERVITEKTRMLLLCNPHNPVGRVWTAEELGKLNDICSRRGVRIVSDEVYNGLLYKGVRFTPMASLCASASLNTVTLLSASKSFNLTGLKHSLIVTENEVVREGIAKGQQRSNMYYGGSLFGQVATEVAFRECDLWRSELMEHVSANFECLFSFFGKHFPDLKICRPESTYFAWIDCSAWQLTRSELQDFFEERANVIVTFGHALGKGGEGHIRMNLACPKATLTEGLERILSAHQAH
ncbi:MAG: PatB family C-S lyase [Pseudomonadota bacterium]